MCYHRILESRLNETFKNVKQKLELYSKVPYKFLLKRTNIILRNLVGQFVLKWTSMVVKTVANFNYMEQ